MFDFRKLTNPYFIAEIGINHNGDTQIAKKLIDAAFACEWDCVKFQKREPDICVPEKEKKRIVETPWGKLTYLDYKKRIEFGESEYDLLDNYSKAKPISWTASVWDFDSLSFLKHYDIPFIKIPSAQITNSELVTEAAKSKIPMLVSTGMSTLEEVDKCVNILAKYASSYALLHTNSAYPSPVNELNLRIINTLKNRYQCPIGYSGHEYGIEPSVIAVVLGAIIIERHITLDHNMWGTDQKASIEIEGMNKLRNRAMTVEEILGSTEKEVMKSEFNVRKKLRTNL